MMKLSEYIKRLQKLKRQCKKIDPDVVVQRFSDYTDEFDEGEYPKLIRLAPPGGGREWAMRLHYSMTEQQKAQSKLYVEVAPGN